MSNNGNYAAQQEVELAPAWARFLVGGVDRENNHHAFGQRSFYVAKTHDRPAEKTPLNGRRRFDGRSPGSRVNVKRPAFPVLPSGIDGAFTRRTQLRGQLRHGPEGRTVFPFNSEGNRLSRV